MSRKFTIFIFIALFGVLLGTSAVFADYTPPARVTFTFDDGAVRVYQNAVPLLQAKNIPAVIYGETAKLASGEDWVMTWEQLKDLRDRLGWEIGSHTINHPDLTTLSDIELENELAGSKKVFADHGITTTTFATPLGSYNDKVLKAISRHYGAHRAAWGGPNIWPDVYNDYKIVSYEIKHTTTPEEAFTWIDAAVANNQWLVFLLHDVVDGTALEYEYNKNDLARIVDYVASVPIKPVTLAQGIAIAEGANLLTNSSFEEISNSFAKNWSRSGTSGITLDSNKNGNFPSPTRSVKIVGSTSQREVRSPLVMIDANKTYILKMFQNVSIYSKGGWGVWVNEYDTNGAWLGGVWLGGNEGKFFGTRYYTYTPKNAGVKSVQLHILTYANSSLTLYVDSAEFRAVNATPTPTPTPTPPVNTSNLITNGSFESQTSGFASSWGRNSTTLVTIDTTNKGAQPAPQNSLKIIASQNQNIAHSAHITVDATSNYELSYYQRLENFVTGGVAVWVNEYDSSGAWLKGQWLGGTYQPFEGTKKYPFRASSANTRRAEFHFFTEAGSNLTLFIDEILFVKP